jgi:large subunit ribosomal protein L6e
MSATLAAKAQHPHAEKTFGKSKRTVPHHSQKAKKYYPAEDEVHKKKVGLFCYFAVAIVI